MSQLDKENYIRFVYTELPRLNSLLDVQIRRGNEFITKSQDGNKDLLVENFAIATGCLINIQDIFTSLRAHLIPTGELSGNLHVFPRSTNASLRVAFESWAIFSWIIVEDKNNSLFKKTMAYLMDNADEARKYYSALGQIETLNKIEAFLAELTILAHQHNFMTKLDQKCPTDPIKYAPPSIPTSIDLCKKLDLLSGFSVTDTERIKSKYRGIDNGEFIYRYLSGHVHGKQWVTKFKSVQEMPTEQEFLYWIPVAIFGMLNAGIKSIKFDSKRPFILT